MENQSDVRARQSRFFTLLAALGLSTGLGCYTDINSDGYRHGRDEYQLGQIQSVCQPTPPCNGNIWVAQNDPGASDDNDGSQGFPFLTIVKAVSIAGPGDTICIKEGTYRERVVLSSGGSDGAPLTLQGQAGEEVWIKGSEVVTGWQAVGHGVWKVPWSTNSQQLFVDGAPQQMIGTGNTIRWSTSPPWICQLDRLTTPTASTIPGRRPAPMTPGWESCTIPTGKSGAT